MKTILLFLMVPLLSFTCNKEKTEAALPAIESLSFGTAYCLCTTNCVSLYLISNQQLFAGTMTKCNDPKQYQTVPMLNDKYLLAKPLLDNFPAYLQNNPNKTFGCPDCLDQGGIHLEIKEINGTVKFWHIDTNVANQPVEIREYIKQLINVLGQL
jgi:hypothetical protein